MTRTGACASPWSSRKSLPFSPIPQISYLPSLPSPCLMDTRIRVSISQQLPIPPVSGKKGALVAIPWLPKSLQVHRQTGKNGNVSSLCFLFALLCFELHVGTWRLDAQG